MHPVPLRAQDLEAAQVSLLLPCLRTYIDPPVCACSKGKKRQTTLQPRWLNSFSATAHQIQPQFQGLMHQLLGFAVILVLIFSPICNNLRNTEERTDLTRCMLKLRESSLYHSLSGDSEMGSSSSLCQTGYNRQHPEAMLKSLSAGGASP